MDVCGAPALTARVVGEYVDRGTTPPVVAVVGGAGKSGSLSLAAARRRRRGAHHRRRAAPGARPTCSPAPALADEVAIADARDPIALRDAVATAGGPADVTVVCVDVPGCEGGAVLATAEGGTVIFFSMATSFSAAALGAEGLAADVRMLVGNGYVPGHAAYALELLRADAGVRALFEGRLAMTDATERPAAGCVLRGGPSSTGGAASSHRDRRRGRRIAFVGTDDDVDLGRHRRRRPEVVDLDGALVGPAFVDAHVHTVRTGFALTGLDLTGTAEPGRRPRRARRPRRRPPRRRRAGRPGLGRDRLARGAARPPAPSSSGPPPAAAPTSPASTATPRSSPRRWPPWCPGLGDLDGWTPDGRVERDAHHAVRDVLETLHRPTPSASTPPAPPCRAMAGAGHRRLPRERRAPHRPESEIDAGAPGRRRDRAARRRLLGRADGGRHRAPPRRRRPRRRPGRRRRVRLAHRRPGGAVRRRRPTPAGTPTSRAEQVRDHVVACTEAGLQAGFHCIGDAALEDVGERLRARRRGARPDASAAPATASSTSRCPRARRARRAGRLGVVASVQPMFDALWGGPDGMYAARLGERWRATNPLRDLDAGAASRLAFGSDSPVTALGPWAAVRAATHHHDAEQRAHHRRGLRRPHPRRRGRPPRATTGGTLALGARADLAVWDVPGGLDDDGLPVLGPDAPLPRLRRLLAAGRTIHERDPTSTPRAEPAGQARPRPGHRRATPASLARKAGRPIVDDGQEAHHRRGRAGHAAPGRPRRAPTPRARPGSTGSWTPCAPTSAPRARRRAARSGTRCCAARPTTSTDPGPEGRRRLGHASGCPRAQDAARARAASRTARSAPASAPSTAAGASASG